MDDLQKTMIVASCLILSVLPVAAQTRTNKVDAGPVAVTTAVPVSDTRRTTSDARRTRPAATRVIVVSLEDRGLALVEDGAVTKVYKVCGAECDAESVGDVHDRAAGGEPHLLPRGPGGASGTGESGGHAVDGTRQKGLWDPWDEPTAVDWEGGIAWLHSDAAG
jgi:hypothetical protein